MCINNKLVSLKCEMFYKFVFYLEQGVLTLFYNVFNVPLSLRENSSSACFGESGLEIAPLFHTRGIVFRSGAFQFSPPLMGLAFIGLGLGG
jgi:hypothetical protein